jgi:hypothetical protein
MAAGSKSAADERAERLAQALRDNLRRRKAQSRERQADESDSTAPDSTDQ